MKITLKTLSLPPYVSTSWDHISSLHVDQNQILIITLHNGIKIEVPFLEAQILEKIFATHTAFLEQSKNQRNSFPSFFKNEFSPSPESQEENIFPMRIGIEGFEGLSTALQHNPEQANAPDLPSEILSKIAAISKIVGVEDPALLPKPEPNCNCMHCQIARAVQSATFGPPENTISIEEEVTEEDLRFRVWDIKETSKQLYTVTNPLDAQEQYSVFLGDPIGCNCGKSNCEHIRAVLHS